MDVEFEIQNVQSDGAQLLEISLLQPFCWRLLFQLPWKSVFTPSSRGRRTKLNAQGEILMGLVASVLYVEQSLNEAALVMKAFP